MFVNDLPEVLDKKNEQPILYADDTNIVIDSPNIPHKLLACFMKSYLVV